MCISIILSFEGTDKERIAGYAYIAFFTLVSIHDTKREEVPPRLY